MYSLLYADWSKLGPTVALTIIPDQIFKNNSVAIEQYLESSPEFVYHVLIFSCMYGGLDSIKACFYKPLSLAFDDASQILLTALHNNFLTTDHDFYNRSVRILRSNGLTITQNDLIQVQNQPYIDPVSHLLSNVYKG